MSRLVTALHRHRLLSDAAIFQSSAIEKKTITVRFTVTKVGIMQTKILAIKLLVQRRIVT